MSPLKFSKSPFVVAIDGPAASGKGTIGKLLANELGFAYLDTGSLYREVANRALASGLDTGDEMQMAALAIGVRPEIIDPAAIRSSAVTSLASKIAAMPQVRNALLGVQRDFARKEPGTVLDGRDIGTVVCPDADVKLFITASAEVRAKRRQLELGAPSHESVLTEIRARDERDRIRAVAPLVAAADATIIDTTGMDIDQAVAAALAAVASRSSP